MNNFAHIYASENISHEYLIEMLVKMTACGKYLELGVYHGITLSRITKHCNYCVGVDIKDDRKCFSNYKFILSTTDDFFKSNNESFDIIFIDADHNFESVKKDFVNSLNILNKFGIILIHDTDPVEEVLTRPEMCGDSYKLVKWIVENYKGLNIITLPITEAGLTIINRENDRRILNYIK
jgi:predicted O-methyltransferase YrrM